MEAQFISHWVMWQPDEVLPETDNFVCGLRMTAAAWVYDLAAGW